MIKLTNILSEFKYNQGGALLLIGKPLKDGKQRLYITTVENIIERPRIKSKGEEGLSGKIVIINPGNVYIVMIQRDGELVANRIQFNKDALGLNSSYSLALNYHKTPYWEQSLVENIPSFLKKYKNLILSGENTKNVYIPQI